MRKLTWASSAYIFTYDEAGGFFDQVTSPVFDAYGAGIRVPTWVISPHAKPAHLEPTLYEHPSILKFIERVFKLPTLASVNHQFDKQTPGGATNNAASGAAYGPPALHATAVPTSAIYLSASDSEIRHDRVKTVSHSLFSPICNRVRAKVLRG